MKLNHIINAQILASLSQLIEKKFIGSGAISDTLNSENSVRMRRQKKPRSLDSAAAAMKQWIQFPATNTSVFPLLAGKTSIFS